MHGTTVKKHTQYLYTYIHTYTCVHKCRHTHTHAHIYIYTFIHSHYTSTYILHTHVKNVKLKFTLEQATKAQRWR